MIAYLEGRIFEQDLEKLVLLVNGVGYELLCSSNTLATASVVDEAVGLWVYTHVREDQFQLFGFASKVEKQLFLSLIKVNGIGPKMAVQILSGAATSQIVQWIEESDVKSLTKLPKVGKKTAEQMILTLKGQLVQESSDEVGANVNQPNVYKDIISALVHLGYREPEVEKVVRELPRDVELSDGIRKGLAQLSAL